MKKRILKGTREATMMALVIVTTAHLIGPHAHADIRLNGTATISANETHNLVSLGTQDFNPEQGMILQPGTLNVTSNGVVNTRYLFVGDYAEGLLNVNGGTVNVVPQDGFGGETILGYDRQGTINVTNSGTLNTNSIDVGRYANGLLDVNGGSVSVTQNATFSNVGNQGTASTAVTNGTLAIGGNLMLGADSTSGLVTLDINSSGLVRVSGDLTRRSTNSVINLNNGGTLQIGNGGTTGTLLGGTGNLTNNGTLIFDRSDASSYSGTLSGSGVVGKRGDGTLTLSAANTYSGGTTLTAGTLALGHENALGTGNLAVDGGTLDLNGKSIAVAALSGNGGIISSSVAGAVTLTTSSAADSSYAGVIQDGNGTLSLTKQGASTQVLTGANTYTGATTVSAGVLNIQSADALGTTAAGTSVTSGATLQLQGDITVGAEALSLNGGEASGQTGALVNISGTNTYGGAVTVTSSSSISAASGSVLNLTGGVVKDGTVATFNGGGTINVNTVAISGSSPNSDLVIDGTTVNLDVASTYNGPTYLRNSGTLNANVTDALPTDNGRTAVIFDGTGTSVLTLGAAQSVASLTSAGAATVTLGANTLTVGASTGITDFAGSIGGTGGLIKDGASTLTLSGANSYSGGTTVSAGVLNIQSADALGTTAAGTSVTSGATLQLQGDITVGAEALSLNGGAAIDQTGALVNVSGTNTYGGAVTVASSSSISAASGSVLNLTGGVVKDGTVATFNGGGTINVNTVAISGSSPNSDLVIDGTTVNLGVASTYNGPTFIRNSGTLNANVTDALPTDNGRTAVIFDGTGTSVLSLGAAQSVASLTSAGSATVTLGANTLTVGASTGITDFAGSIGGTGGLIKDGASTLTLSGANSYSGGTTISAGTLELSGDGALTDISGVNIHGGTLLLTNVSDRINHAAGISLGSATGDSILRLSGNVTEALGAMTLAGENADRRVIDFGSVSGSLSMENLTGSSSQGVEIWNWTDSTDHLYVKSGSLWGGLTTSNISFFSDGGFSLIGTAQFTSSNEPIIPGELVPVPEASTLLAVLGLIAPLAWRERRHWMRCREARG